MTKQTAIERLQKEAAALLETARKIEVMLPDDLPTEAEIWGTYYDLRIELPFNLCLFKRVRRLIGKGWKFRCSSNDEEGARFISYLKDGAELTITLNPYLEGSTCQRIRVSEKVTPVYRVVCN